MSGGITKKVVKVCHLLVRGLSEDPSPTLHPLALDRG